MVGNVGVQDGLVLGGSVNIVLYDSKLRNSIIVYCSFRYPMCEKVGVVVRMTHTIDQLFEKLGM